MTPTTKRKRAHDDNEGNDECERQRHPAFEALVERQGRPLLGHQAPPQHHMFHAFGIRFSISVQKIRAHDSRNMPELVLIRQCLCRNVLRLRL